MVEDLQGQVQQLLADMKGKLTTAGGRKGKTYPDWDNFGFKLPDKSKLAGEDNWEAWKTASWVALIGVGYTSGSTI